MAETLLVWFENRKGEIQLPPTFDTPLPPGFERREAHDIYEVIRIEKRIRQQEDERLERQLERDSAMRDDAHRRIRRSMMSNIASSSVSEYEKDFLREWCKLRDGERRDYYTNAFNQRRVYLEALHYDRPQTLIDVGVTDGEGR